MRFEHFELLFVELPLQQADLFLVSCFFDFDRVSLLNKFFSHIVDL